MGFKTLKVLDWLRPIFEKMGIDYPVMRNILFIKLLMDGRRVPTVFSNEKKNNESENSNKFLRSLWIYVLFGLILIPFIMMKSNYVFQMGIVFGIVMFLVITSLISDFSSVLLDIRDKNIIGTKPVDPRTISMAKTIHIIIYMFFITAALTSPALLISLFVQGPLFFLLFLITLIFIDMFSIILTTLVYFLILKFFDGERLKDVINYIQIILSIAVTVGYQLVGRLFNIVDINIKFVPKWWQYFIIPIWFSAPFQIIKKQDFNRYYIIFAVLAAVVPVISLLIYIRLMPIFEKNLQKLSNNYGTKKIVKRKSEGMLSKLLCPNKEERIFFRFTMDMMKNERTFKLKVYPSLGFSLIFPFIFLFQLFRDEGLSDIVQGKSYLMIYFCGIMLPTIIMMIGFSESFKAAWIYKALPIKETKPIFRGTVKAIITRLFVPMYLLEALVFAWIYGVRIIPDLILVFVNMILFSMLSFLMLNKSLPFSKNFEAVQQANNVGTTLLLFALLGVLAGIHYFFTNITYGVFIFLCLSCIMNIVLWETAYNVPLEKLDNQ